MENKIKSGFTHKEYSPEKVCRIVNMAQLAAYLEHGVELLDLYSSRDRKTGRPMLVGVVDKKQSYEAYRKWCEHELN